MPFSNNANKLFSHHIPNLFLNSTINKNPLFPKSYLQFHSFVADANTKNQMGSNIALYIVVSVVFFAISKIVMAVLCYRRWKRRQMLIQDSFRGGKLVLFRSPGIKPDVFLKKTMKLSNKDIIGSGGFGTVYKLIIDDCIPFAVKRLNRLGDAADQDRGFQRELAAMGDIKHRNVVSLHGYYTAPHYHLLIYDLMPNGSLDALLHGKFSGKSINKMPLDWCTRYKIAVGAARGISYLHHDCIPHIIHRDIKSSNILLDHNLEARVSDFGLATLMEPDKTHVSTLVAGTFGYLAPATAKGDVYSFGVVLLELLTGKKPTDETFIEEGTKLVTWVKSVVQDKREEYVIDSSLVDFPVEEANNVFSIALMCLEAEPTNRPTMAEVVKMLEQIKPEAIK
ncbi:receptor-like serine/threonine-protein kinase At1g78530 isoform X3 [Salvia hispanica]|uniref:receptor-like serine/threonine-protein kinase At1g78530 isoform X3 n=1 Tax=Salvia hispanica TaxID=49212 RepID=UPI002009B0A3|nr:receptor-like serine/threonine-protein kinase At1g78530 isoform X3 [Salvia hispanica]